MTLANIAARLYQERFGKSLRQRLEELSDNHPITETPADFTRSVVTEIGDLTAYDIRELVREVESPR